ncbi:hypothetical protein TSMEX_002403 [Taenia solium]|eukprot:TsM_000378500 transcript=TsM_000378500 gene=TsM_000378500
MARIVTLLPSEDLFRCKIKDLFGDDIMMKVRRI